MKYEEEFMAAHHRLVKDNPDLIREFEFAAQEIPENTSEIEREERILAQLAVCLGACAPKEAGRIMKMGLKLGVDPVKIQETVYQAIAYCGLSRIEPALGRMNRIFKRHHIHIKSQNQIEKEERLEKGNRKQAEFFGAGMIESWKSCPPERAPIMRYLADNCFGDFYTRSGLSDRQREMITFCFLYAQGGCEPQAISHAAANLAQGNDRDFLYQIVECCLPLIGYPRSLNALNCIDQAAKAA